MTSSAASKDPAWKTHVSLNQWYMQKAIMYGTAANFELISALLRK